MTTRICLRSLRLWKLGLLLLLAAAGATGWHLLSVVRQERLNMALYKAVEREDVAQVVRLLRQGANPNVKIEGDRHLTWQQQMQQFFARLRGQQMLPSPDSVSAIEWAVDIRNPRLVTALLDGGANPNAPCREGKTLLVAVQLDMQDSNGQLLTYGADVTQKAWSSEKDKAMLRDIEEVSRTLLEHGANPNANGEYGETALTNAIGHAPFEVPLLLEKGANPNIAGAYGYPLASVAGDGDNGTVRLLLAHGANVNATDYGKTALMEAAQGGYADVVQTLLAHGADTRMKDKDGMTALMLAKQSNRTAVVRLLQKQTPATSKPESISPPASP